MDINITFCSLIDYYALLLSVNANAWVLSRRLHRTQPLPQRLILGRQLLMLRHLPPQPGIPAKKEIKRAVYRRSGVIG